MVAKVEVPVACVTSCCFGGSNLDELYITTASRDLKEEDRPKQPDAGGIFVALPDVKGTPSIRFKG
jgi:sugar lactone lactonase YvrE